MFCKCFFVLLSIGIVASVQAQETTQSQQERYNKMRERTLELITSGTRETTISQRMELYRKMREQALEPEIFIWPNRIGLGDTVYIKIEWHNTDTNESHMLKPFADPIQLVDQLGNERWTYTPIRDFFMPLMEPFRTHTSHVAPGKKFVLYTKMQIPPLNELNQKFWMSVIQSQKHLATLSEDEIEEVWQANLQYGEQKIPMELYMRPLQEVELLDDWFNNTPKTLLPIYRFYKSVFSSCQNLVSSKALFYKEYSNKSSGTNFIRIKDEQIEPRLLVDLGNHTPGDPNCPETWQGWKELEDFLMPSTMRDEIRMTRIVIQYCDTEDSKVLDELTEWLQTMNEIQRIVMVQNVMNLQNNFPQGENIRTSMDKLIETIQPFAAEEISGKIE